LGMKNTQISFTGTIVPYYHRCPQAYRLKTLGKRAPKHPPKEGEGPSRRHAGIDNHNATMQYIKGELGELEYHTETIEEARTLYAASDVAAYAEQEFFLTFPDLEQLYTRPEKDQGTTFISIKPDFMFAKDGQLTLWDWKFANPNWGQSLYFDEVLFFTVMLAPLFPDITDFIAYLHYPIDDYTPREHEYNRLDLMGHTITWVQKINRILADEAWFPRPQMHRCRLCDYRSEDAGGSDDCEASVL